MYLFSILSLFVLNQYLLMFISESLKLFADETANNFIELCSIIYNQTHFNYIRCIGTML